MKHLLCKLVTLSLCLSFWPGAGTLQGAVMNRASFPYPMIAEDEASSSEFYQADVDALKKMAADNYLNEDLRGFIDNETYKKDIYAGEGYNVGVTWTTDSPKRVRTFFIDSYQDVTTLDFSALTELEEIYISVTLLTSLDLSAQTKLKSLVLNYNNDLYWEHVALPASHPDDLFVGGHSLFRPEGVTGTDYEPVVTSGTEIDLSRFATYEGKESAYQWYRVDSDTYQQTPTTMPGVDGKPGVFRLEGNPDEMYMCEVINPIYDDWRVGTPYFHVETPKVYHDGDLQILAKIISDSGNEGLTAWWNEGCWQTGENKYNAQVGWNDDNPCRLTELYLYNQDKIAETVDLSGLDALQILSFTGSQVKNLTLPEETSTLYSLTLDGDTLLTSLDVRGYTALEHLDIGNTRLQSCDVRYTPALQRLHMQYTPIPGVETTAPEIARQLTEYGVPSTAETIDLADFPVLRWMDVSGTKLTFSKVKNPRQLEGVFVNTSTPLFYGTKSNRYSSIGTTVDYSAEMDVNGTPSVIRWWIPGDDLILSTEPRYTIEGIAPGTEIVTTLTNPLFPGWNLTFVTTVYIPDGDSNEQLRADRSAKSVYNTPNPFRGTTTFCYALDEPADEATIRIFSPNGVQAAVLQGLPAAAGMNRYTATLSLPAGVYYYRLETRNANGILLMGESNALIVK